MLKQAFIFFFLFCSTASSGQSVPLDQNVQNRLNVLFQSADTSIFTAYRATDWLEFKHINNIRKEALADSIFGLHKNSSGLASINHLLNDNWIQLNGKKSIIAIDPYIEAGLGKSNQKNGSLLQSAIGIRAQGVFNDKISFGLGLYTSQSEFPAYVDAFIQSRANVIPGQNTGSLNSNGRYTYSHLDAHFTYVPNKHILLSTGYGKQFIGDGYRSLFLSDNSFNYPFIRLQARFWKFTYNVIYSKYVNTTKIDGKYQAKYSATHLLGINLGKKWQIGLFDNILWLGTDSNNQRGFDVQYLSPIIFMRTVEFALGAPDNAMLGFTFKYNAFKKGYIYGQVGLDDIYISLSRQNHQQNYHNKYALQLGIWNYDIFRVKGLTHRLEWNAVRPYTYGHEKVAQNYTHFNQALADPFNANFHEFISILQYNHQRWYALMENLLTLRGEKPPGQTFNNGEDLWGGQDSIPLLGSKTLQGIKHTYLFNKISFGYLLNPKNRLSLQADLIYRSQSYTGVKQSELYFSIGIKTNLFNTYHDF